MRSNFSVESSDGFSHRTATSPFMPSRIAAEPRTLSAPRAGRPSRPHHATDSTVTGIRNVQVGCARSCRESDVGGSAEACTVAEGDEEPKPGRAATRTLQRNQETFDALTRKEVPSRALSPGASYGT